MTRVVVLVLILSLLFVELIYPPVTTEAATSLPSNSFNFDVADHVNKHRYVDESFESYRSSNLKNDEEDYNIRLAKVKMDDFNNTYLYNAAVVNESSANGYIIIDANNVNSWIAHYGQVSVSSDYVQYIRSQLQEIIVYDKEFDEHIFYNHAEVASMSGGAPGTSERKPIDEGYILHVSGTKTYNQPGERQHSMNMTIPENVTVGEKISIDLSITEGSYYVRGQQTWVLSVRSPSGEITYPINFRPRYIGGFAHQETLAYTFSEEGTHRLTFQIEDTSFHNNARTGTANYSVVKDITVQPPEGEEPSDPDPTDPNDPEDPPPIHITADLTVTPNHIAYRDAFRIDPVHINVGSTCTYDSHQFRIQKDGRTWTSNALRSMTQGIAFTSSNYPSLISVGTHSVSIKVKTTDCGETDWLAYKTLTVTGPTENNPPTLEVGWTRPGTNEVVNTVIQGDYLDLKLIDTDDPDGDTVYWDGFDFDQASTDWLKRAYGSNSKTSMHFSYIRMDDVGFQRIQATVRDEWGATTSRWATVDVIPPNPVPVITGPNEVIEGRPLPQEISGNESYSPIHRSIVQYDWTNKHDVYMTPGEEIITLEVVDDQGRRSLPHDKAEHVLTVKPDLPPIGQLGVPPRAIRDQVVEIYNESYSPDNDAIVSVAYRYKYDSNNNGFEDDEWVAISGEQHAIIFTPEYVGKYVFDVEICEDWGQCSWASETQLQQLRVLDVINLAPTVSFEIEGKNEQPTPNIPEMYTAQEIINNWTNYVTNSNKENLFTSIKWSDAKGVLQAGMGRRNSSSTNNPYYISGTRYSQNYYEVYFPSMNDYGYGNNNLTAFKPITETEFVQPLLYQGANGNYNYIRSNSNVKIQTNENYIYYSNLESNSLVIYAMNISKIGHYDSEPYFSGQTLVDLTHFYRDEMDPVDFTIKSRDFPRIQLPRYSVSNFSIFEQAARNKDLSELRKNGVRNAEYAVVKGYAVSDKTLYVALSWECYQCVDYSNTATYYVDEIRSYDAYTGEFIASNLNFNNARTSRNAVFEYFTINDDLVTLERGTGTLERHNRDLELTATANSGFPKLLSGCNYQNFGNVFRDHLGNFYFYGAANSSTSCTSRVTLLTKYNSDLSFGWTKELEGSYPTFRNAFDYALTIPFEDQSRLFVDPFSNQVIAVSVSPDLYSHIVHYQIIDIETGEMHTWHSGTRRFGVVSSNFGMDWNGNYVEPGLYTIDGFRATRTALYGPNGDLYRNINQPNIFLSLDFLGATVLHQQKYESYISDGIKLSAHTTMNRGYPTHTLSYILSTGATSDEPVMEEVLSLGQFMSNTNKSDVDFQFGLKMHRLRDNSNLAGFSFRMQDPRNRYAVETDGYELYLAKYINGFRTVLDSTTYPFQNEMEYDFRIRAVGDSISVSLNSVPYLSARDDQFSSGMFGPFTDKTNVGFSGISTVEVSDPFIEWMTSYAIWEENAASAKVNYKNIRFEDPEHDPMSGAYEWSIQHAPRFLNHQGKSEMHGQTFTSEQLFFDKVGDYIIGLSAQDDPHPLHHYPADTFAEYRQSSNEFMAKITVHRRPIAKFTLSFNADGSVRWHDTSYDPDRWLSDTHYSTENTGIDYRATRGIVERKYYYITPSGQLVESMLVTPQETGLYYVGLAVKDEYGAWSTYAEKSIEVVAAVAQDEPPKAGFNLSHTTVVSNQSVSITSTASDKEDGVAANIAHEYWVRHITAGGAEQLLSTNRGTWQASFSELGTYEIRQVVTDSKGQTAQLTRQLQVVNRPPTAAFTWTPKPVWEGDVVTLHNESIDPDGDSLSYTWRITMPDGVSETFNTLHVTQPFSQGGTYEVTLTVSDGRQTATSTQSIVAHALLIVPEVHHTPQWLERHEKAGHETASPPKDFYSGERFVLKAVGSAAPIERVTATLNTSGLANNTIFIQAQLEEEHTGSSLYTGELYDIVLSSLTGGLHIGVEYIHFRIDYQNGVTKEASVPINIIGNVQEIIGVKRKI